MIRREDDGIWVEMRETIACHHDEVFHCLTTSHGLKRWYPVAAEIDLRPGGKIVLGWDADFIRTTTVAILDYDPGGRMVWDWQTAHEDTHAPLYWKVEPSVEEGSRVILRQGPFKPDPDVLISMAEEVESWRWYLTNLRTVLEAKHDMRRVRPL
jgi:uncharacterized protein YndB with AHSA1/START domain